MQIQLVHERDTTHMSRYSETFPGHVMQKVYITTGALRQEFGCVPKKLTLIIETKED